MNSPRLLFLLLLVFPMEIQPLRVLFYANIFAKTHLDYIDSLMNALTDKGHVVDLVLLRINDKVVGNGKNKADRLYSVEFPNGSPWGNASHLSNPFQEIKFEFGNFREWYNIAHEMCEIAVNDDNLLSFIGAKKYDIAVTTTFDFCPYGVISLFNIPSLVCSNPVPIQPVQAVMEGIPNPPSTTLPLFQTANLNTLIEKFWNVVNWAYIHYVQVPEIKRVQEKIFKRRFGNNFSLDNAISKVDLSFINSNEIMEKPRAIHQRIQYIGGINLASPKPVNEEFNRLLSRSSSGTVIFSLGTQVFSNVYPRNVVKNFVKVFKKLPEFTFLWKYDVLEEEKKMFEEAPNVFPVDWLPQTDLLYDDRVVGFISHVGLNSFNEASYAGKPIVAIPLFADQPHNADNGVLRGTTFKLDKMQLTEKSIEEGLRAILFNPSYRQNSENLRKMLNGQPNQPKQKFVQWMEFAAENPGLHKIFELPGAKMGMLEYFCIDAVLFVSISCFFIVSVLFTLLRNITSFGLGLNVLMDPALPPHLSPHPAHSIFEIQKDKELFVIGIIYICLAVIILPISACIVYAIHVRKDLHENISYKLINVLNYCDIFQSFCHILTGIFLIFPILTLHIDVFVRIVGGTANTLWLATFPIIAVLAVIRIGIVMLKWKPNIWFPFIKFMLFVSFLYIFVVWLVACITQNFMLVPPGWSYDMTAPMAGTFANLELWLCYPTLLLSFTSSIIVICSIYMQKRKMQSISSLRTEVGLLIQATTLTSYMFILITVWHNAETLLPMTNLTSAILNGCWILFCHVNASILLATNRSVRKTIGTFLLKKEVTKISSKSVISSVGIASIN